MMAPGRTLYGSCRFELRVDHLGASAHSIALAAVRTAPRTMYATLPRDRRRRIQRDVVVAGGVAPAASVMRAALFYSLQS